MTRIILTRHGHVERIVPERFRGRSELSLSRLGEKQAEALGSRVSRSWSPAAIYTSPLSRCVNTGEAIARATNASASTLAGLVDIDYGQWQGLTHEDARTSWPGECRAWFETRFQTQGAGKSSLVSFPASPSKASRSILSDA